MSTLLTSAGDTTVVEDNFSISSSVQKGITSELILSPSSRPDPVIILLRTSVVTENLRVACINTPLYEIHYINYYKGTYYER